jgi:hypothetical protein
MGRPKKLATQVLTANRDGSLEGLQRKGGVDLRKMGEVDINRASEVSWSKTAQKYYIIFYTPSRSPFSSLGSWLWEKIVDGSLTRHDMTSPMKDFGMAYFKEYEEAVEAEIKTLDYLRVKGFLT